MLSRQAIRQLMSSRKYFLTCFKPQGLLPFKILLRMIAPDLYRKLHSPTIIWARTVCVIWQIQFRLTFLWRWQQRITELSLLDLQHITFIPNRKIGVSTRSAVEPLRWSIKSGSSIAQCASSSFCPIPTIATRETQLRIFQIGME